MAKITRKKLARGTKIYPEQTHGALSTAATQLTTAAIDRNQFAQPYGSFRLNLNLPYLNSSFVSQGYNLGNINSPKHYPRRPFAIPFTFVPFQEDVDITARTVRVADGTFTLPPAAARFYVEEMSFSFDQRAEGAAISDRWNNTNAGSLSADVGKLFFGSQSPSKGAYEIRLAIAEKEQTFFDKQEDIPTSFSTKLSLGREVWSFDLTDLFYKDVDFRQNPVLIQDINVVLETYRTYVFLIYADGLAQDRTGAGLNNLMSFAMPNIMVSMKCRTELVPHDTGNDIQNIPTHDGAINTSTVTVTTPAVGTPIAASGASGLSESMGTIDKVIRDRISGGYTENCEMKAIQRFADDSCYEVIAVPLMQNRREMVIRSGTSVLGEPYIDAVAAGGQILADRRIIPLTDPMTIQHVILGWNWQIAQQGNNGGSATTTPFYIPTSAGFTVDVGVGMGTGLRSDRFAYDQIASLTMVAPDYAANPGSTWYDKIIDRFYVLDKDEPLLHPRITIAGQEYPSCDLELHSVPLVGAGGSGYYAQGKPVFVGKGRDNMEVRRDIGGGASNCRGEENFLEVRMTIKDTVATLETDPASGHYIYSGYQGHFVYLICKKSLK